MKKELPRIYLDMDGVLCDFGKQIEKATGKSKAAWLKIPTSRKVQSSYSISIHGKNP